MAEIGSQLQRWLPVERMNSVVYDGSTNKGKWKPQEDAKLTEAVKEHCRNRVTVAALVPRRTHKQCHSRWVHHLDPDRASSTLEEEHNASNDKALDSVPI
jgi:hypothetical protein